MIFKTYTKASQELDRTWTKFYFFDIIKKKEQIIVMGDDLWLKLKKVVFYKQFLFRWY